MRSRKVITCLLLIAVCCGIRASNSFSVIQYENQNGLETADLYGITQDYEGYIWIGSNLGLYRFDGNSFKNYGNEYGIHSRLITRVVLQEDSSLLLIGESPTAVYKMKDDQIITLSTKELRSFKGNDVAEGFTGNKQYLIPLQGKELWVFQRDSLYRTGTISRKGQVFIFQAKEGLYGIFKKYKGLTILKDTVFESVFSETFDDKKVLSMTSSSCGDLWLLSEDNLYHRNVNGGWKITMKHELPKGIDVAQMKFDQKGKIWIKTFFGEVFLLDTKSMVTINMRQFLKLGNVQATYIFNDRFGNLWIPTLGNGLYCVFNSDFTNYTSIDGLAGDYITELAKGADNILYIGSNLGMTTLYFEDKVPKLKAIGTKGYITGLSALDDGTIIAGGAWDKARKMDNIWFISNFRTAFKLENKEVLVGSWGKIKKFNPKSLLVRTQVKNLSGRCQKIIEQEHSLWVLTKKGLFKTKDQIEWEEISIPILGNRNLEYELEYYDMLFDKDNNLWLATSNGIYYYREKWKHLLEGTNLSSKYCRSLACDITGRIWVGTERGLNQWDGENFLVYTKSNGLLSDKVNALEYDSVSNLLWIGTAAGLSMLDLNQLESKENNKYSLLIDQLEVPGDTIINHPSDVYLLSNQRHVKIHFSCLNYNNPNEASFQYKIAGEDKWIKTNKNWVEYHSLSPGEYTFKVQSRVYESVFEAPVQLHFSIALPFWQRTEILILTLTFILLVLYGLGRFRIKKIKEEEEKKRQYLSRVNQLERKALHSSMNPHFIFNALNSIQHYVAKYKDVKAINYVAEFSRLIRGNMEITLGTKVTLQLEIDQLRRYIKLESFRMKGNLDSEIIVDEGINLATTEIPSMLIQPFVENSIWHGIFPSGNGGKLILRFTKVNQRLLRIEVEDNGIGLYANKKIGNSTHVSRGIRLIKERILLLSTKNVIEMVELKDSTNKPSGTLVSLILELS